MRVQVTFNKYEEKLLLDLENIGLSRPVALKMALRYFHKKEIPQYLKNKEMQKVKDLMTPEQKCKEIDGEVVEIDGVKVCQTKDGALTVTTPLENFE